MGYLCTKILLAVFCLFFLGCIPAYAVNNNIDYLIITSEAFKANGVFQSLIDSKTAKGLSVEITAVEAINTSMQGRDSQEKIRNYIKNKFVNDGVCWVLLGGDNNIVPCRLTKPSKFYDAVASDMYYSDLDGNWDANNNNIFGEFADHVDLYPDVFVGRAPVANETEAKTFVNKILTYESNIPAYASKALFFGFDDYDNVGQQISERIIKDYFPETFNQLTKYYESGVSSYSDLAVQAINQGYHLINHIDHGEIDSLFFGDGKLSIADIDSLNNQEVPSILISSACYSAAIDKDCIANHWITSPRGGGVAFVGNSGVIGTASRDILSPEFYNSLFKKGITHIGQAVANSKIAFIEQARRDYIIRYALFVLNLLGDPEMDIYINKDKFDFSIISPHERQFVKGMMEITGSAFIEHTFERYELYYAKKDNPDSAVLIASSIAVVSENLLGRWDTTLCDDGEYVLTLKLFYNGGKLFTRSAGVIVDNISQPPVFVNLNDKAAVINRSLQFEVKAEDPDDPKTLQGQLLDYRISSLPPGAEFFFDSLSQSYVFSWLPREENKGIYEISFTVRDNEHSITKTVVLTTVIIEESQITDGAGEQQDSVIYGSKIFWLDYPSDICMYDLSTMQQSQLVHNAGSCGFSVFENKLVYSNGQLHVYDILNSQDIFISVPVSFVWYPRIYENKIIYRGDKNNEIYVYDLSTNQGNILINNCTDSRLSFSIYADKVACEQEYESNREDIYMYDLATEEEKQLTTDVFRQVSPSIYKDKIVWSDFRNNKYCDIYMYDISKKQESRVTAEPVGDESGTGGWDSVIFEDKIAWVSNSDDIYLHDLSTGLEFSVIQYGSFSRPLSIYEDKIVWTDYRNGNADIYMARVNFCPRIISINPSVVSLNEKIIIKGVNFGYHQQDSKARLSNGTVCVIENWSNSEIVCRIEKEVQTTGLSVITVGGESNAMPICVRQNNPDLTIKNIYNDNRKVSIEIGNIGKADSAKNCGHLFIWIDGKLKWTYSLNTLYSDAYRFPGNFMVVQCQVLEGWHTIKAQIDSLNKIAEENENNNIMEKRILFTDRIDRKSYTYRFIKRIMNCFSQFYSNNL